MSCACGISPVFGLSHIGFWMVPGSLAGMLQKAANNAQLCAVGSSSTFDSFRDCVLSSIDPQMQQRQNDEREKERSLSR